ncbi:MAG: MAPEG family protein [Pseudomonadota bacterium]
MEGREILQPLVALAAWTMVMWLWMYLTRVPAMKAARVELDRLAQDPEASLDRLLPPSVQWKAHNYNHLHEAPTVFYAVTLALALLGQGGDELNLLLAWAYVSLRMVHSLVQVTVNRILVRFGLFVLSSLVLIALILRTALAAW